MDTISYTSLRQNLREIMDRVTDECITVEVTRLGHEPVVMMAKHDFEAMQETLYLLSNPNNVRRLFESIEQEKQGALTPMEDL